MADVLRAGKVDVCKGCPLYSEPLVPSTGPSDSPIMFVGEAPSYEEVKNNEPFVGRAGQYLNGLMRDAGIERNSVYIANALRCQIPWGMRKTGPEIKEAIEKCRTRLAVEVRRVNPTVIVACGDIALKSTTGMNGITKQRGELHKVHPSMEAWVPKTRVLPTFHPAFLLRGKEGMRKIVIEDLKKAIRASRGEPIDRRHPVVYRKCDTFGKVVLLFEKIKAIRGKNIPIAVDIETSAWDREKGKVVGDARDVRDAKIFTWQVSFKPYEAWVIFFYGQLMEPLWKSWQMDMMQSRIKRLMEDPELLWVLQHAPFDLRHMHRAFKVDVSKVNYVDLLLMQALADENLPKDLESMALMYTDLGNYKQRIAKKIAGLKDQTLTEELQQSLAFVKQKKSKPQKLERFL